MEIYARSTIVESMWPEWCMIETLRNGTRAMRQAGQVYLPKWPMEDAESYRCRVETSFLFNGYEQTVESLSGRPFAEPIKVNDNVPASIASQLDDVDMEGRNLHAFARDVFRTGVAKGHSFILVDFPSTTGAATQADLKAANARPYMTHIDPMQVLYWDAERIDGVMTLTEVRLWELQSHQAGLFSTLPVLQVRVLKRDVFEVWQPIEAQNAERRESVWTMVESGPNTLGKIPLVPFYALRTGFMQSRPPLLDLAYMNVEHWQSSSDQRSILHTARVPLLAVVTDDENFSVTSGAKAALRLPVGSDAKWVETSGRAIEAGRQDLLDLEERMQQLGAELIQKQMSRQSATQSQILSNQSESKLGAMAQNLEDALNIALYYWAQWIGEPDGGTVEVYQDFGVNMADNTTETTLLQATVAGKLSDETFFNELQRRGTINSDLDYDTERERLAAQGPALGSLDTLGTGLGTLPGGAPDDTGVA